MESLGLKSYFAIVHKDGDSAYGVTFPDLPGCFSAADELDDVLRNAAEALELWLEDGPVAEPGAPAAIAADHADDLANGAFLLAVPYRVSAARPGCVDQPLGLQNPDAKPVPGMREKGRRAP